MEEAVNLSLGDVSRGSLTSLPPAELCSSDAAVEKVQHTSTVIPDVLGSFSFVGADELGTFGFL